MEETALAGLPRGGGEAQSLCQGWQQPQGRGQG